MSADATRRRAPRPAATPTTSEQAPASDATADEADRRVRAWLAKLLGAEPPTIDRAVKQKPARK